MSDAAADVNEYQWRLASGKELDETALERSPPKASCQTASFQSLSTTHATESTKLRPSLRTHKSFPHAFNPAVQWETQATLHRTNSEVASDISGQNRSRDTRQPAEADLEQTTFGGSAPTSPAGQLTPHSPMPGQDDALMDDDDIDFGLAEQEEGAATRPMTAAELRAHKRKMKRFRLTHNQTRFLMSEFARQAHPDAAHRERLSREIPGLSPRQVQVWFQNRRAKLKRLTTDDRERMMKSRALPADFDMTQALHAPFGTSAPVVAAAATSSRNFSPYSNTSGVRPLTLDTLRREPDHSPFSPQYTTPTNITPAIGGFGFTPPQSATDTISPGSAAGSMSALNVQHQNSPRYPFGGQFGQNAGYINYRPQMPRLQTHDRIARPMGETASSPLRASMSYTGPSSASGSQRQYHEGIQLHSEQALYGLGTARQSRGTTNPDVGSCGPYGLGFSYEQVSSYVSSEQHHQHPSDTNAQQIVPFQRERRSSSHLAGPAIPNVHHRPPNFTAPVPQFPQFGAQFTQRALEQPFEQQAYGQSLYRRQSDEQQQQQRRDSTQVNAQQPSRRSYAQVPSQMHQISPLAESATYTGDEAGDNGDGDVRVPRRY